MEWACRGLAEVYRHRRTAYLSIYIETSSLKFSTEPRSMSFVDRSHPIYIYTSVTSGVIESWEPV